MGGDRQIRVGDIPHSRVLGSDGALSHQQYPPQVRSDVVEGGAGDGDQAGGDFDGVTKHSDRLFSGRRPDHRKGYVF